MEKQESQPHLLPVDKVLGEFKTSTQGLSNAEVETRRKEHGPNKLPEPRSKTLAAIFLHQFLNPLIYVLIAAAIVSAATGDAKDAIFIGAIILINAILGTFQEWRAENSAKALRDMVHKTSRVRRDNQESEVDSEQLVPGDIVLLESGNSVPADLRLIDTKDLTVEESLLTGESAPVVKNTEPLKDQGHHSIGDRINTAFAATVVTKGRATGVVVAIGEHTEMGKIADSLKNTVSEKPPLERRMEVFSKRISIVVLATCIVLGVVGFLTGIEARDIFFLMVAVGVSAIPEGLPVALTVALSIGTRRMAKRNVIVRKLPAVEGLGSCTLIASDKTGTLTMDEQSVQSLYLADKKTYKVTGQGYNGDGQIQGDNDQPVAPEGDILEFMVAAMQANESNLQKKGDKWEHTGDSVDVGIRALAFKLGKDPDFFKQNIETVEMVPYESDKKYSAVFYKRDGKSFYAMKGAAETVVEKLKQEEQEHVRNVSDEMAGEGLRVLALAGGEADVSQKDNVPPLRLLGLIGMIDPLRPEAKEAVDKCRKAGIEVVMITGDHPSTAYAIASSLGIVSKKEEVIAGVDLVQFDQSPVEELRGKIEGKKVFARVAPLQKQRIVEALKSAGHFVAVTGDGANDAPALKSAHIGVAMGSGTDLAKEASSIIITDDNFASITAGVEEGRVTFSNLRKIIYMLVSTGAAELLTVALSIFFSVPLPFIAVQLLWLNLVTNGIQDIALSFEKGESSVMSQPPRKPDESIFDKLMNTQVIVSGLYVSALVFGIWLYLINGGGYEEKHARTMIMMLMVLIQNFHALNCRSETASLFSIPVKSNYVLFIGVLVAQAVHIAAAYIPGLGDTLELEPITLGEWAVLLPLAASVVLVMEVFKLIWRRSHPVK